MGRSHQTGLIQKLRGYPSGVYYSKRNKILTECSWGDPGRLNSHDKKLRGDPSRVYYSKLNTILTECSWGDPGRLKLL